MLSNCWKHLTSSIVICNQRQKGTHTLSNEDNIIYRNSDLKQQVTFSFEEISCDRGRTKKKRAALVYITPLMDWWTEHKIDERIVPKHTCFARDIPLAYKTMHTQLNKIKSNTRIQLYYILQTVFPSSKMSFGELKCHFKPVWPKAL